MSLGGVGLSEGFMGVRVAGARARGSSPLTSTRYYAASLREEGGYAEEGLRSRDPGLGGFESLPRHTV